MANDKNTANKSTRPKSTGATSRERSTPLERGASPFSIEGIRGGALNHAAVKWVMFLLILIFAVGFLITSFNPTAGISGQQAAQQRFTSTEAVARVGDDTIQRGRFETIAARQDQMMEQFGQHVGPLEYFSSRQRTLQQLTDNAATVQAARAAGLTVSSGEIDAEIKKQIDKQLDSEKQQGGEANFRRQVEAQYGSLDAYRAEMQKQLEKSRDDLEKSLLVDKLEKKIKDENKVTEDDYKRSVTKLQLREIVIRPKAAGLADKAAQDKNKAEAKAKADKLVTDLKKTPTPQNFATVAKKESDDLMTKSKGGDLGWKLPSELPVSTDVRDAVVKSSGKVIGPIADPNSGDQYIFFIENRALKLPKDYAKNKAKLLKDFETQSDNDAWQKYQSEVSKAATVEVLDPALQAYKTQTEQIYSAPADQQNTLRQDAVQKYETALTSAPQTESAAIRYQLSMLYRDMKEPKKAVEALKKANEEVTDAPQLQLEYARALRDAGDKKAALAELQKVSKYLDTAPPAPPSMFGSNPNDALHYQIAAEFEALGKKDLASKERAKVKPQPGGMGMPGITMGR
jgi:hypothetical protein